MFHDNNAIGREKLYIIIQRKLGLMGVSHWVETIEHARLMQEEYDFFVVGGGGGESLEYV